MPLHLLFFGLIPPVCLRSPGGLLSSHTVIYCLSTSFPNPCLWITNQRCLGFIGIVQFSFHPVLSSAFPIHFPLNQQNPSHTHLPSIPPAGPHPYYFLLVCVCQVLLLSLSLCFFTSAYQTTSRKNKWIEMLT